MSTFSDLLREHMPDGWTGRRLAREAQKRGFDLSPATVNNYLKDGHGVPTEPVIEALAKTLPKVTETQLRRAAGVQEGEPGPYVPPAVSARLSRRQRIAITELILSITESVVPLEDDNVRALHPPKQPVDVDAQAARTAPSFAAERSQADTDQLGEDSQDPGSDEPV